MSGNLMSLAETQERVQAVRDSAVSVLAGEWSIRQLRASLQTGAAVGADELWSSLRSLGWDRVLLGDSGMGMTHGTIAGMLLTDLIAGRANPWTELYDPARVRVKAATEFARENVNVAGQYMKWVKPGEVESAEDIIPGQGAIVSKGTTKLAVYRDSSGNAHVRSAVCPHLRCLVSWNGDEQTWDCPCHGSRFDRYGKVLNGPANTDLARTDLGKAA